MDNSNVYNIASEISSLVINKVLSKQCTLDDALVGILSSPAFIYAKTLSKEDFDEIINNADEIATKMRAALNDSQMSVAEFTEASAILARAFLELNVKA